MAAFTKFNSFVEALAEKAHNLGSDQLTIAVTSTQPTASSNSVIGDIVAHGHANLSSRSVSTSTSAQTSGIYKLVCNDLVLSASGTVAPFRYVVLYNNTATNDELIGYWDYGSTVSLANTETFTIDFDQTNGVLTIT
jgi:hypothetical protein